MNVTIRKFGYPATLIKELDHWAILLRPAQVTLGSLVLAAKSEATAYGQLSPDAFGEQAGAIASIESSLAKFCQFERINYLMLMMVDPNVHFHVIPRYQQARTWRNLDFPDAGWPGPPKLESAIKLADDEIREMVAELSHIYQ